MTNISLPIPRADDGYFLLEIDKCLEHSFVSFQVVKRWFDVANAPYFLLALTVITEPRRFKDRWCTEFLDGLVKTLNCFDVSKFGNRKTVVRKKGLFPQAILRGVQNIAARMHIDKLRGGLDSSRWYVFEFEGHDIY